MKRHFFFVGRAHCTEERRGVLVLLLILVSEVDFLYLCRVEDSERKVGVMVEGQ